MYLDPNFGSLLIQALIGLAVSIPVLFGMYWTRVKKWFKKDKKK